VQRCLRFAKKAIADQFCFQDAMRLAYQAALCSPDFLYLLERPGEQLDGLALAARLSYFLWRSAPDEELRRLGRSGRLTDAGVLREQTERLLKDPRSERFVVDFTGQWLELHNIRDTVPDRELYPEYFCDIHLIESCVEETRSYFRDMLENDAPARHVATSDYAIINERLAQLYGLNGVEGTELRRVSLPKDTARGGLITQASVLKVTANGLTTSPVLRGAWILDRVLGTPAPDPPPGAGSIEPDTRGATTVREQLEKHREVESCANCQRTINPPKFALKNFDVMGKWRTQYRSFEKGEPANIKVADRKVKYKIGPPVDATGETQNGREFGDIRDYRQILLRKERQIARNLVERLIIFSTGAKVSFADRGVVQSILDRTEDSGYGVRSVIHEIVQSRLFRHK
jgi:hypothetical protein